MNILITGATGFIGQNLVSRLLLDNHSVTVISRSAQKARSIFPNENIRCIEHDLNESPLPIEFFEGHEAIAHLMGESIKGRWSQRKKEKIFESRKQSTENLMKYCPSSIKCIISASAQGIYPSSLKTKYSDIEESQERGSDFLAKVCEAWESPILNWQASHPACRTLRLRIGLVLDPQSGILKEMLPAFQYHLGGKLGSGQQWMSWIALSDLTKLILHCFLQQDLRGIIHGGSPNPVTNSQWTETLCSVLKKRQGPSLPPWALKILFGEMSEVMISSVYLKADKAQQSGFVFDWPVLENYLKAHVK